MEKPQRPKGRPLTIEERDRWVRDIKAAARSHDHLIRPATRRNPDYVPDPDFINKLREFVLKLNARRSGGDTSSPRP